MSAFSRLATMYRALADNACHYHTPTANAYGVLASALEENIASGDHMDTYLARYVNGACTLRDLCVELASVYEEEADSLQHEAGCYDMDDDECAVLTGDAEAAAGMANALLRVCDTLASAPNLGFAPSAKQS